MQIYQYDMLTEILDMGEKEKRKKVSHFYSKRSVYSEIYS